MFLKTVWNNCQKIEMNFVTMKQRLVLDIAGGVDTALLFILAMTHGTGGV